MKPAPSTRNAIANTDTHDRRANSLSSPPNTSVPPATINAINDTDRATGPVSEVATKFNGVSQGRPPPPPPAQAAWHNNISKAAKPKRLSLQFTRTSPKLDLHVLDLIAALAVPGHHQQLAHLAARRHAGLLVDKHNEIDRFGNQRLLRRSGCLGDKTFEPD